MAVSVPAPSAAALIASHEQGLPNDVEYGGGSGSVTTALLHPAQRRAIASTMGVTLTEPKQPLAVHRKDRHHGNRHRHCCRRLVQDPRLVITWLAIVAITTSMTLWSFRTEFSVIQQLTCKFGLFHGEALSIPMPQRLDGRVSSYPQTQALRTSLDQDGEASCSPRTMDASTISYPVGDLFYSALQSHQRRDTGNTSQPSPPLVPVFRGNRTEMCDEASGRRSRWAYCLPITGRKDEPHCSSTDRMDLLSPSNTTQDNKPCFASVLHMIFVDVYDAFLQYDGRPLVLFGTLLGAIRSGAMIPFTEDADLGYVCHHQFSLGSVREALWARGYHMFYHGVWRVCVAPTHPLASLLYDANMTTAKKYKVPYVDLYAMNPEGPDTWPVDKMINERRIEKSKFEPPSQVQLNGKLFATVADPIDFLVHEYGSNYNTPDPR